MCISHQSALWRSVYIRLRSKGIMHRKGIMRRKGVMRKKPGPCEPSFLVPIVTTRLSVPNRGRNPRRHEYRKIGQAAMNTQAITVPHKHQDSVRTSTPLFKPFGLSQPFAITVMCSSRNAAGSQRPICPMKMRSASGLSRMVNNSPPMAPPR